MLVYCGQTVGWIKMALGVEVNLSPGDFVLDGNPAPSIFGQCLLRPNSAWIKIPLGTDVGLGPDDIVLNGDPAFPSPKGVGAPAPIFGPCLLWPNGLIDQDDIWHGGGPWSRPHCARWGPSYPPQKMGQSPQFSAHFCCAKGLDALRCHLVWR